MSPLIFLNCVYEYSTTDFVRAHEKMVCLHRTDITFVCCNFLVLVRLFQNRFLTSSICVFTGIEPFLISFLELKGIILVFENERRVTGSQIESAIREVESVFWQHEGVDSWMYISDEGFRKNAALAIRIAGKEFRLIGFHFPPQ